MTNGTKPSRHDARFGKTTIDQRIENPGFLDAGRGGERLAGRLLAGVGPHSGEESLVDLLEESVLQGSTAFVQGIAAHDPRFLSWAWVGCATVIVGDRVAFLAIGRPAIAALRGRPSRGSI